jgi:nucleotide-binding universal stress UspA family protein
MHSIKKILFPTDFSATANNAFRYLLWFADQFQAQITLLHLVYPEPDAMDLPGVSLIMTEKKVAVAKLVMQDMVDEGMVRVQAAHDLQNPPEVIAIVEIGVPDRLISEYAEQHEMDLIVMGTQGEHSVLERLMGSVTTTVIRKAPCPVMVIPEQVKQDKLENVAFATSLSTADPYHIWQASRVLKPFNPVFRIVHVAAEQEEESEPIRMEDLQRFFADYPLGAKMTFHQLKSQHIAEQLAEFSESWSINLLVMHRPARNLSARILHQSMTRQLAFLSKTPLLILK